MRRLALLGILALLSYTSTATAAPSPQRACVDLLSAAPTGYTITKHFFRRGPSVGGEATWYCEAVVKHQGQRRVLLFVLLADGTLAGSGRVPYYGWLPPGPTVAPPPKAPRPVSPPAA